MTCCGRASHNLSDPGAERQDDLVSEFMLWARRNNFEHHESRLLLSIARLM